MPFYHRCDLRLHYVCRGAQSGDAADAILFQHGIGGDVRQPGRFLIPERTAIPLEELRVLHADFRGHGESELGAVDRLSIETLAYDMAALLDHLGIERAVVGGISMGAAVALRLAVLQPERCRALILCRPAWAGGSMSLQARRAFSLVAELLAAEDWQLSAAPGLDRSEILRSIEEVCPDAAKSIRGQVASVLGRPESRECAIARLRHLPFSRGLDDLQKDLAAVRCATLILSAEGDPLHPFEYARQLAQHLPNCRLAPIAPKSERGDAPHLLEVDHEIGAFLREIRGS